MSRYIFCISAIAVVLQGCGIFLPEYSLNVAAPTSADSESMGAAKTYAAARSVEINSVSIQLGAFRLATDVALLSTAGGAVGAAAFRGTRDLIVGLVLGSSGTLSVQYLIGLDVKRLLIDNARIAIGCARQFAEGMSNLAPPAAVPPAAPAAVPPAAATLPAINYGISASTNMNNFEIVFTCLAST